MMKVSGPGNFWVILGSISAFLGVCAGAFGAHALSSKLDARSLSIFQTGAQYQMYHALALIGLGVWINCLPQSSSTGTPDWIGYAFLMGILLFSGSLYALSISGIKFLGAITPIGGVSFLLAWLGFAWQAWKTSR